MADQTIAGLHHLLERNQVFASFHYITNLPDSEVIPNKEKLVWDLQHKINQARELTANINHILEEGDYPQALLKLKKAQRLVGDFPNIQTDIDFINASISTAEKNLKEAKLLAKKGDKQRVDKILKQVQQIDRNHDAISEVEKRLSLSRRNKSLLTMICVGFATIIPLVYFSFEQLTLKQAQELWSKADELIKTQHYDQAQEIISAMDSRLQFVRFTGQDDKVRLLDYASKNFLTQQVANSLATAEDDTNGNERYVTSLLRRADNNAQQKKYAKALVLYNDALTFTDKNIHIDRHIVEHINQKRLLAVHALQLASIAEINHQFTAMVQTADTLFRNDNWQLSAQAYNDILNFATDEKVHDFDKIALVRKGYITSMINQSIEDGEVAFNQSRYNDAITAFQSCLQFMEEQRLSDQNVYSNIETKLQAVRKKQFMVTLSNLIHSGDQLYQDKKYELSADKYGTGLMYLVQNDGEMVSDKARLIQDNLQRKKVKAEEKVLIQKQSRHLVATYKRILRNNFNLSRNTHFKSPEVVFIGNKDNNLIYTVSAFGAKSKSASPVKYELNYKFNIHTGKWIVNDIRLEV